LPVLKTKDKERRPQRGEKKVSEPLYSYSYLSILYVGYVNLVDVARSHISQYKTRCHIFYCCILIHEKKKLHGLSPRANYTDRATAACRRSDYQFLRIEGATWSAWRIPYGRILGFLDRSRYFSIK
jgi:hypothetical protein